MRGTTPLASDYGEAYVRWEGTRATLFLNGVESSCIDTADPRHLEFEYMQHFTCVLDAAFDPDKPLQALHLGAAACALPWAWSVSRPASRHVAVEIDQALAAAVREEFELPRAPQLRIRVGEARQVLDSTRPASKDVIIRDAFMAGLVPEHLTTVEYARVAAQVLGHGGVLMTNAGHGGGADARPELAALREVFPHVCAVIDPKVGHSGRRGNVVFIGSSLPLPTDEIDRNLRRLPLPARLWHGQDLVRFQAGSRPRTDQECGWGSDTPPDPAA
ncbi:MAG: fused MFS/spermidine synthase [Actinomycetaceae bacterium]|nr:fused MFS/spermidine synthase [Actinomycetaceae bacterium]